MHLKKHFIIYTRFIGRKNRLYEILARKRPLTLRMIEGLHETFSIPAESLLRHSSRGGSHAAQGRRVGG